MLTRIVKMTFKNNYSELFLSRFDKIKEEVNAQEGCHSMRLVRDVKNEGVFFTISLWDNEEHLNTYRNSDFFKTTWTTIKPWFEIKAEAWSTSQVWPNLN